MALFKIKPWYKSRKNIVKFSSATLSKWMANMYATHVGDYAIFSCGMDAEGNRPYFTNAFNNSLTKITKDSSSYAGGCYCGAATHIGNYAIFGGGMGNSYSVSRCFAYDTSLTYIDMSGTFGLQAPAAWNAATHIGNYAMFGGGFYYGYDYSYVTVYNDSLSRSTAADLASATSHLGAAHTDSYAIFCGGTTNSNNNITAYNSSLVKTVVSSTSLKGTIIGTSLNNHALFRKDNDTNLYVLDDSLTLSTIASIVAGVIDSAAVSLEDYALFGGGKYARSSGSSSYYVRTKNIYVLNKDLTLFNTLRLDVATDSLSATCVDKYALFAGGCSSDYITSAVNNVTIFKAA